MFTVPLTRGTAIVGETAPTVGLANAGISTTADAVLGLLALERAEPARDRPAGREHGESERHQAQAPHHATVPPRTRTCRTSSETVRERFRVDARVDALDPSESSQIAARLRMSPSQRLRYLLNMLAFEALARRARRMEHG